MRGRPNDPVRAKAKARAHANRAHHCTCGAVVHGNGGKAAHFAMHERRGDGQHRISAATWEAMQIVAPVCSQCGGSWFGHACGPTHAYIADEKRRRGEVRP